MAVNIGPRIKVEGEEEYRAEINKIIQQSRTLDAELKKITAGFSKNATEQEKAAAKAETLSKRLDVQRKRVDLLRDGVEKATKATGEDSNATEKWKQALFEAEAELGRLETELKDNTAALKGEQAAETAAAANVDKFADATDKSRAALSAKAVAMGNIIASLTRSGVQLLREIGSVGLEYDRTMERYTKSLANSLGSTQAAADAVANIKLDAKNAPLYSVDNLIRANQMLISTGENADDARATIMALSEAISATGGGNDELTRMASNLQQIKNAGKATAMDIRQFAYAGIDVYGVLADYTGKAVDEVKNLDVSYAMLSKALQAAAQSGGKYYGANAAQAQTLNGQIAALSNTVKAKLGESFEGVANQLRDKWLPYANAAISALNTEDAVRWIGDLTTAAVAAGGAIYAMAKLREINALADDFRKTKIALDGMSKAEKVAALNMSLMNEKVTVAQIAASVFTGDISLATAGQLAWNAAVAAFPGALLAASALAIKEGVKAMDDYVEAASSQGETIDEVRQNLEALQKQQAEMEQAAKSGMWTELQQREHDSLRLAIGATTDRLKEMEEAEHAAMEAEAEHAAYLETTEGKCDSLSSSLQELIQGYQEAYEAAQESLSGQFGLFEQVSAVATISTADMLAALQSQADYFNSYAANLSLLESLTAEGIGLSSELVAQLNDGSNKSVSYTASLVQGYREALAQGDGAVESYIQNINAAFDNQQAALANAASSMAESKTKLTRNLDEIVQAAKNSAVDMDQYTAMRSAAVDTIQGYIDGLSESQRALYTSMSNLGANAMQAFYAQTPRVNVPTANRTGTRVGINGSHAAGLDYVPFDGYIAELHKGEMVLNSALASELRQTNNTHNYGGFTVQVYGAPGQDINALADEIMYRIEDATARREAVFR